ncbi:MAG: NEL-type E3 ubiquitin ligase domain-containing protein [Candidatus Pseudomonas phytovorans]|uniref:RING-type E3 ubiquitin transferase n=1 Tax=Candidatus Pseudomonas phytovorans TaxID=3121377 RepID=A0AAJ6B9Z7_9PSED|nr:NEL-type E3 ubiquitin ligase domain-containing protein [Pseudomonas sp.]WEK29178.1 MAG: NEL-type E3 ubiquitin ligase domain-containing protein [Pseudomonas sp.]
MTVTTPPVVRNDPLAVEQAYQDGLIADRLPAWMRQADTARMTLLCNALQSSVAARQRLSAELARLQGIDEFVGTRLQAALGERFGLTEGFGKLQFIESFEKPLVGYAPVRVPLTVPEYYPIPLLEAALHNFTADQARGKGQPPGHCLRDGTATCLARPSAVQFAALCRELDLGKAYQQYLQDALAPCAEPLLTVVTQRMLFDALKARLEGVLDEAELQMVIGLCRDGRPGRLQGNRVIAKQLQVLGCQLQQIVVLDVRDERLAPLFTSSRRVLVYIPGDPMGPWSHHDSLATFARKVLGQRLREGDYQTFFQRFVLRRDSQRFFSQVINGYHDLAIWANIDLDERMQAYEEPLFFNLTAAGLAQIKLDAASIAMPVNQLDRKLQAENQQWLVMQAWTLLGIAGLFVTTIGVGLLAVTAFELLEEVYRAIEAWREDDVNAAAEHFRHVALGVASVAAVGAGAALVHRAWKGAAPVDAMVSTQLEDGSTCLWDADITAFRSDAPPNAATRDAQGVYRLADQTWIEMDGHHYPVHFRQSDQRWYLQTLRGHAPLLHHNGAGAWRLACEQPAQWDDTHRMFRRLGGSFASLSDQSIDQVLAIHELGADQLRAWHVRDRVPDATVVDTVMRLQLASRIERLADRLRAGQSATDVPVLQHLRLLDGAEGLEGEALGAFAWEQRRRLFEQMYDSMQDSDSSAVAILRRLFPSVHPRAAQALVQQASAADRERLSSTGRVPLRLAEAAHATARRIRLARVFEALQFDTPQTLDLARVVLEMVRHLPAYRTLHELDARGMEGLAQGRGRMSLVHLNGRFAVLAGNGQMLHEPGELFQVLADTCDPAQHEGMQPGSTFVAQMRQAVQRVAQQYRADVERLLLVDTRNTWFNPPRQLTDDRLGYPLSGRGSGQPRRLSRALQARLRKLYPEYTDAQLRSWIGQAPSSLTAIEQLLARLEGQLADLNRQLRTWVHQATDRDQRENRRFFRQALRDCWQRRSDGPQHSVVFNRDYRWSVYGARPGNLPELPATVRFEHVFVLSLRGMQVAQMPESFLAAFPNLRVLELPGNRLQRVPQALMQMPYLQCLDLFDNHITLDPGQSTVLASCERLSYLNLSHNPLGRLFSLTGLTRLSELYLCGTRVAQLPNGLLEHAALRRVDLRDNLMTALPEHFYQSRIWREGDVRLRGNPLTEAEQARFSQAFRAALTPVEPAAVVTTRLRWLDAVSAQQRGEMGACWDELEYLDGSADFFHLLGQLLHTADFQHSTGARYLAHRVLGMLQAMRSDVGLRAELFGNANQLTCRDSAALRFTDLELRLMAWHAQADALRGDRQHALLRLGRQLWRLEQVDRIALEDIQARLVTDPQLDQLEVLLGYRLALRDALELPVRTNSMTFVRLAGVQQPQVVRATAQVLGAETGQALAESLIDRDFWQTHLIQVSAARIDALNEPYHARLEALQEQRGRPEGERIDQMNALMHERQAAERELLLQLTLEALDAGDPQAGAPAR